MNGKDQQKRPGKGNAAKPGATGQPKPPQAATGPVIASAPLPETTPETPAEPLPPIRSALVGEGGDLPPMEAREPDAPQPVAAEEPATLADALAVAETAGKETVEDVAAPVAEIQAVTEADAATMPVAEVQSVTEDEAAVTEAEAAPAAPEEPAPAPWSPPPATEPPPPPPPPPQPAPRGGFWPLVAGGILAAGLGAGATFWLAPKLQTLPPPAPPVDIQALKDQILAELPVTTPPAADADALSEAVSAALREALPQIEAAAADEVARRLAETPADAATPATLATAVQALGERLDALDQRLSTAAGMAVDTLSASVQSELAAMRTQLTDLAARPVGAATEAVEALSAQLAALPPRLEALEAREAAQAAALSAAAQLSEALRSGTAAGRDAAAQALSDAGQGAVAGLAQSVPTLAELQAGFDRAARDALSAARAAAPAQGVGLLGSFLADQTNARSVAPRAGDDPDAIQSRAGAAVEAGDIPAALAELAALPEVARDAMAPWLAQAEAWTAAQAALGQITQPATQSE